MLSGHPNRPQSLSTKKAPKPFNSGASNKVLEKGVEPLRLAARDPKSRVSANSTTQADLKFFRKHDLTEKCKLYYRKKSCSCEAFNRKSAKLKHNLLVYERYRNVFGGV